MSPEAPDPHKVPIGAEAASEVAKASIVEEAATKTEETTEVVEAANREPSSNNQQSELVM